MPNDRDYFPTTQRTWIDGMLEQGESGRPDLVRHVLSVYFEPLRIYCRGLRRVSSDSIEPDKNVVCQELVTEYLSKQLADGKFLEQWRKKCRDNPIALRRWLMNGLHFHLRGMWRSEQRWRDSVSLEDLPQPMTPSVVQDMDSAYDRAFVRSIARNALDNTRTWCDIHGYRTNWVAFSEHWYRGRPYHEFADELGLETKDPEKQAKAAERRAVVAKKRFQKEVFDLIRWDGASKADLKAAVQELLELSESATSEDAASMTLVGSTLNLDDWVDWVDRLLMLFETRPTAELTLAKLLQDTDFPPESEIERLLINGRATVEETEDLYQNSKRWMRDRTRTAEDRAAGLLVFTTSVAAAAVHRGQWITSVERDKLDYALVKLMDVLPAPWRTLFEAALVLSLKTS